MPSIALVDDDRNILTSVSIALEAEGFELLVAQARRQFEIMTGKAADFNVMAAAGTQWLQRRHP